MITINNANKYFNRHKKNELHVINNTSLTLDDTGLVALLGQSGSGKTTLLNVIGGLDKLKSGKIYINGILANSKLVSRVDKTRNLNVGYIFQDYKLLDNMTVYDNVALVLKMLGIKDKNEIKKRVEYVLDNVGMLRYKRRPAGMLSGGERQRVAIARAIVKNPSIILADEPTGNLDSKNSLEIMKIIKSLSKDRLVILVTHEQTLAKFYATRIIEIKDGMIEKDYLNKNNDYLDYEIDNTIYLKDIKNHDIIKKDFYEIDLYNSDSKKIKLDIVLKNNNIYIRSNTSKKIEVIDDNSSIELVNDNYKQINKEDIDKYNFDLDNLNNKNIKLKYSSIFNIVSFITKGFQKIFDYSILKKILLLGFILSGMFITYATSSIMASITIKDSKFVVTNKNYLIINQKNTSIEDFISYEEVDDVNYILPGNSQVNFIVKYNDYYQTNYASSLLKGSLSSTSMLKKEDLIVGKLPVSENEIVVDKLTINRMFNEYDIDQMLGIDSYEYLLNKNIYISNMHDFIVVGISDLNSPSIYADESEFINIIDNSKEEYYKIDTNGIFDYTLFTDKINVVKGRLPESDYEVIVNTNSSDSMPLNKEIDIKINDKKLIVVGYYDSKYDLNLYLVNNNTIKYNLIRTKDDIVVYSKNSNKTLSKYRELGLNVYNSYESDKNNYVKTVSSTNRSNILVSSIILLISLVEIFLMIRSSFLSRIKEVGIYRAIGVKKKDIYIMFMGEIIALTSIACVPGIIFMAYILSKVITIKYFADMFVINIGIVAISIIFIYIFNLIIGLLPVFNTIRKTPASILARHDLD